MSPFLPFSSPKTPALGEGFSWKGIVSSEYKNSRDELRALFRAFLATKQLPYHATGPNSNTYAHELLNVAGFKVADRFTDWKRTYLDRGNAGDVLNEISYNPVDSYPQPMAMKIERFFDCGLPEVETFSTRIGPTSTIGWSNDAYKN